MPSAEHASVPQETGPSLPGAAPVIHLADRRGGPTPRAPKPAPHPASSPAQELAFTLQAMYAAQGQTLTDPATAQAFETALSAVLLMVDGARAQDVVGEEQAQALRAMLEDMQQAPTLV